MHKTDCLILIKSLGDYSNDFIFGDPPFNLGSTVFVDVDNQPKFKGKAKDFMNKWEFTDVQWKEYFKQCFRVQKFGAYHALYGMDRQLPLVQYYALAAGYEVCQSIYWFFTSSMPKPRDASKMIDVHYGHKREVVGYNPRPAGTFTQGDGHTITAPACELSEQYDGHKYGIAPLKQCLETIMVFRKPCKNSTVIADIIASQTDSEITPSVINVGGEMVATDDNLNGGAYSKGSYDTSSQVYKLGIKRLNGKYKQPKGRFPSQLYCTTQTAEILDKQSDVLKKGGCSHILHKCDYDKLDFDLLHYYSKASQSERHSGLDNAKNTHPTIKPISLNTHIANLFKLPTGVKQTVLLPFSGVGSEYIGLINAGYNPDDIIASELSNEYLEIAQARIKYHTGIDVEIEGIKPSAPQPF